MPTWFDATLGEAFVLARRPDGDWTYLGVARQAAEAWHIESVDDATWRAWGEGRSSA